MIGFLVQAIFTAIGLWIASAVLPGVEVASLTTLAIAALALGVVNALIKPIAVILTLPLTIITLGLFLLVINGAMIGLVAMFMDGFKVDGLIPAILAAVIVSITSWIGSMLFSRKR
jgi:putative membrane protein